MKTTALLLSICTQLLQVSSAPVAHGNSRRHIHHRRQPVDWATVDYDFSGVDWSTVNYDLANVDWATVFPGSAATATPVAAAASPAQTQQLTVNNDVVQAVVTTPAAATPTATLAPAVSSDSTSSSGKRGLGWASDSGSSSLFGSGVSWYFNWSPTPSANMPSSWEFYANIWGSGGIETLADTLSGSPKLIGFNEPDSATQSNLDVSAAISLYQQYLVPLKSSGKISELGTPAVTNSQNAGQGLDYLSSFVEGCTGCNLDFAVVHWYAESLDDFMNHVTQAHQLTGLPVNVAEFAYTYAYPTLIPRSSTDTL